MLNRFFERPEAKLVCLILAFTFSAWLWIELAQIYFFAEIFEFSAEGEVLARGLPSGLGVSASNSMPLFPALAYLSSHLSWMGVVTVLWILRIQILFLVFTLARQIGSAAAAWTTCGGAAFLLAGQMKGQLLGLITGSYNEQYLYAVSLLVCANILIWHFRHPRTAGALVLGASVGLSLLVRSPLVFFPPVLAFYQWRSSSGLPVKKRFAPVLYLLIVPYLFLVPRMSAFWKAEGRLLPVEDRRLEGSIVTAAMGLVPTIAGDFRTLAGIPKEESSVWWSVKEVAAHPGRYFLSCIQRAAFAASLDLRFLFLVLAALFLMRKNPDIRRLVLLWGYFIFIHLLLPVSPRFLIPACFLILPAAGAALGGFEGSRQRLGGSVWVSGCLLAFLALPAFAWTIAYPEKLSRIKEGGLAFQMNIPWDENILEPALRSFQEAYRERPGPRSEFYFFWALAVRAKGAALPSYAYISHKLVDSYGHLLRFLDLLQRGQAAKARHCLARINTGPNANISRLSTAEDKVILERLRAMPVDITQHMELLLKAWPCERRIKLIKAMEDMPEFKAVQLWQSNMECIFKKSTKEGRVELVSAGEQIVERLLARYPKEAKFYSDHGVLKVIQGKEEAAMRDLERALELNPAHYDAAITLAGLYQKKGEWAKALALHERILSAGKRVEDSLNRRIREDRRGILRRMNK